MTSIPRCALLGSAFLLLTGAGKPEAVLSVRITPAAPVAGHVPYIDIEEVAGAVSAAPGSPLFSLAVLANTVVTSANDLEQFSLSDATGPIPVHSRDRVEDGSNTTRDWLAERPVKGPVTLRYRVPIDAQASPLALPQYEIRTENDTVSAAANAVLVLPADTIARKLRVIWDFSHYGPGGVGVSSFGIGDSTSDKALSAAQLGAVYIMAGHPGTFGPAADGFFGAWQGTPPFVMAPTMRWAAQLHHFYGKVFGMTPPRFGVFGRTNARNPGSGIGLTDSFAFTFNQTSTPADLRSLLAHEMVHSWVNSLDGSMDMSGGLDRSWFGEGLAVHYQRALPWRAGMISADDFLADLNETAGRYYTNALIATPNAAIPAGFWRDTRIRVLPYDRGSLYFDRVDAEIRTASHGRRSLDDIVRVMLASRSNGAPMDEALYRRLLRAELGEAGIAELDSMLAGATMVPPDTAYGPRFHRVTRLLRRFDLGFDPASLTTRPKIVRGLVAGSQAALAGLREGDEITNTFPQDKLQGDQSGWLTLEVKRGGNSLSLRYQPRADSVAAYQWVQFDPGKSATPQHR